MNLNIQKELNIEVNFNDILLHVIKTHDLNATEDTLFSMIAWITMDSLSDFSTKEIFQLFLYGMKPIQGCYECIIQFFNQCNNLSEFDEHFRNFQKEFNK